MQVRASRIGVVFLAGLFLLTISQLAGAADHPLRVTQALVDYTAKTVTISVSGLDDAKHLAPPKVRMAGSPLIVANSVVNSGGHTGEVIANLPSPIPTGSFLLEVAWERTATTRSIRSPWRWDWLVRRGHRDHRDCKASRGCKALKDCKGRKESKDQRALRLEDRLSSLSAHPRSCHKRAVEAAPGPISMCSTAAPCLLMLPCTSWM